MPGLTVAAGLLLLQVAAEKTAREGQPTKESPAAIAPQASAPTSTPSRLPVLSGYSVEACWTVGMGSTWIALEEEDLRVAFGRSDLRTPFEDYRSKVRATIESVLPEFKEIKEQDSRLRSEARDLLFDKHHARVLAAIDAAQAQLMAALEATDAHRQRAIRNALWREARSGDDRIGFDSALFYLDDSEASSKAIRTIIEASPERLARVREEIARFESEIGPSREVDIAMARVTAPKHGWSDSERRQIAERSDVRRGFNNRMIEVISAIATECGARKETLEWRARALKVRCGSALLPDRDLLDSFDAAREAGDELDAAVMEEVRLQALELREAAILNMAAAVAKCRRTLSLGGPEHPDAIRVVERFKESARKWEECEQRLAVMLKAQLRNPASPAAIAIDGYLLRQDALAWDHWRITLQNWRTVIGDQTVTK